MSKQVLIEKEILHYPVNELIYVSKLYQAKFAAAMSEHEIIRATAFTYGR